MPRIEPSVQDPPAVEGSAHAIRPNAARHRPRRMIFLDTETKPEVMTAQATYHKFELGVTCYYHRRTGSRRDTQDWTIHRSPESVCREIDARSKEGESLYLFASNPVFDLWVCRAFHHLHGLGWKADFFYDRGMRFILIARKGDRVLKVLALQNYLDVSIEEAGHLVGKPKLETDPLEADGEELRRYCIRDVEILRDAVLGYIRWCDRHDVGGWGLTVSAQAHNLYRHRFMNHRLWVHRREDVLALERAAYHGALTEAFYVGGVPEAPVEEYDVNSLYPKVMHDYPYPANLRGTLEGNDIPNLRELLMQNCVVAKVTVEAHERFFPVRYRGRLVFPTGRFTTHLCTGGLWAALDLGAIKKVHWAALYEPAYIFRDYVGELYDLRQKYRREGAEAYEQVTKKMLNALYGKFGQAPPLRKSKDAVEESGVSRRLEVPRGSSTAQVVTRAMGTRWIDHGRKEGRNAMPAVAAHVSEYARLYMMEIITSLPPRTVYYCDTDSLWIPASEAHRIKGRRDPEELGALSLRRRADSMTIHGAKDYEVDGERVIKGIRKSAIQTAPDTFEQESFPGLKTLFRVSDRPIAYTPADDRNPVDVALQAQRHGLYPVRRETRTLEREYHKGKVEESGWVTALEVKGGG